MSGITKGVRPPTTSVTTPGSKNRLNGQLYSEDPRPHLQATRKPCIITA